MRRETPLIKVAAVHLRDILFEQAEAAGQCQHLLLAAIHVPNWNHFLQHSPLMLYLRKTAAQKLLQVLDANVRRRGRRGYIIEQVGYDSMIVTPHDHGHSWYMQVYRLAATATCILIYYTDNEDSSQHASERHIPEHLLPSSLPSHCLLSVGWLGWCRCLSWRK